MSPHRVAAYSAVTVVAAAIGVGLYLSGSPAEQRLIRLDERRITDLQQLSVVLNGYVFETETLPAALEILVDGRRLSVLPRDPVTGAAYEYEVVGERQFLLCAHFSRSTVSAPRGSFWAHDAGRHCFDFDYSDVRDVPVLR